MVKHRNLRGVESQDKLTWSLQQGHSMKNPEGVGVELGQKEEKSLLTPNMLAIKKKWWFFSYRFLNKDQILPKQHTCIVWNAIPPSELNSFLIWNINIEVQTSTYNNKL